MNLIAVALVYAGLVVGAIGLASVIRPLRRLGVRSRRGGGVVAATGVVISLAGFAVPAPLERVGVLRTGLDRAMPAWQFHERHRQHVAAPASATFRACLDVTADDILLFRTLAWIRSPHLRPPEGRDILTPAAGRPMLDAVRASFMQLSVDPGHELVFGTLFGRRIPRGDRATPADYVRFSAPGVAKATFNFVVEQAPEGGSDVTTETRVFATDARTARFFGAYWRLIYPGSALIRRMWLRAIKHRAEAS